MGHQLGALAICAAAFVYVFLQKRKKLTTVKDVPGPVNPSWIFGASPVGRLDPFHLFLEGGSIGRANPLGHQWYIQTEEAGGAEKRFLENFGNVVRWNGPFGVHLAFIEYTPVSRARTLD